MSSYEVWTWKGAIWVSLCTWTEIIVIWSTVREAPNFHVYNAWPCSPGMDRWSPRDREDAEGHLRRHLWHNRRRRHGGERPGPNCSNTYRLHRQLQLPRPCKVKSIMPKLRNKTLNVKYHNILLPSILFINTNLLLEYRKNWRFLYSSASHDKSLAEMASGICYNRPTILVIKVCQNKNMISYICPQEHGF